MFLWLNKPFTCSKGTNLMGRKIRLSKNCFYQWRIPSKAALAGFLSSSSISTASTAVFWPNHKLLDESFDELFFSQDILQRMTSKVKDLPFGTSQLSLKLPQNGRPYSILLQPRKWRSCGSH